MQGTTKSQLLLLLPLIIAGVRAVTVRDMIVVVYNPW